MRCINCRNLYKSKTARSEKWGEEAGRLEDLTCLLGVEMSQSSLRRQTKPQVNQEQGEKQEVDIKAAVSSRLQSEAATSSIKSYGSHDCEAGCDLLFSAACSLGLAERKKSNVFTASHLCHCSC